MSGSIGLASWFGKRAVELEVELDDVDVDLAQHGRRRQAGHAVAGVDHDLSRRPFTGARSSRYAA